MSARNSSYRLLLIIGFFLSFSPLSKGIESKLQWQNASLALEFEYDEGPEYEQEIPLSAFPPEKHDCVMDQKGDTETIRIEEVFGWNRHTYEAYYFKSDKLIRKIDF